MLFKVGLVLLAVWLLGLVGVYRIGDLFHVFPLGGLMLLFFATAAFPAGTALAETKMGALLSFVAAPIAVVVSRILRVRAHWQPSRAAYRATR